MEENKYTFENKEYRDTYRHTTSHILAQAVKRLYPETKLAIGPAIEDGFYYDFDSETVFTAEVLEQLEAEMRKICKEKLKLERFELSREEALEVILGCLEDDDLVVSTTGKTSREVFEIRERRGQGDLGRGGRRRRYPGHE